MRLRRAQHGCSDASGSLPFLFCCILGCVHVARCCACMKVSLLIIGFQFRAHPVASPLSICSSCLHMTRAHADRVCDPVFFLRLGAFQALQRTDMCLGTLSRLKAATSADVEQNRRYLNSVVLELESLPELLNNSCAASLLARSLSTPAVSPYVLHPSPRLCRSRCIRQAPIIFVYPFPSTAALVYDGVCPPVGLPDRIALVPRQRICFQRQRHTQDAGPWRRRWRSGRRPALDRRCVPPRRCGAADIQARIGLCRPCRRHHQRL